MILDKHFYLGKAALSKENCQNIISSFENHDDSKKKFGPHNPYCLSRKIHYFEYLTVVIKKDSFIYPPLMEHLDNYGKLYPFLKNTSPWGIKPSALLQKYLPGEHYAVEHCEQNSSKRQIQRMIAWMFYLNDINEGGGTKFPQQDIELKPRAGDLYIWPAFWTHSHFGLPAKKEFKYIITGHCEYNVLKEYS